MDNITQNYQFVETVKPATLVGAGQRLYIGDQPQLRTQANRVVQVKAITVYSTAQFPVSPAGNALATPAQIANAFLVLNVKGKEQFLYLPLVELNPFQANQAAYSANVRTIYELDKIIEIDWTKSYFQFGATPGDTVYSLCLGVRYYYLNTDQMPISAL